MRRRDAGVPVSAEEQQQFAAYAADLAGELARMARQKRLDTLGYLFDMVQLEAKGAAEGPDGGPPQFN